MTVKVELEFKSVDEAIVALGKLIGATATVRGEPQVVPETPREAKRAANRAKMEAIQAEVKERRPRADKGKLRGPYKNTGEPVAPTQPAAPAVEERTDSTVTLPPAAAVPTPEQVQGTVEKLFNAKGYDICRDVLSRYGVARGKDLAPEVRADFIKHAEGVIAGTEGV